MVETYSYAVGSAIGKEENEVDMNDNEDESDVEVEEKAQESENDENGEESSSRSGSRAESVGAILRNRRPVNQRSTTDTVSNSLWSRIKSSSIVSRKSSVGN